MNISQADEYLVLLLNKSAQRLFTAEGVAFGDAERIFFQTLRFYIV